MSALPSVVEPARLKPPESDRPAMPVQYETALKALEACISLDETKIWSNAADALAAWAKIYNSDEAEVKAKRLRLHAYRRMGQLARDLRPPGRMKGGGHRGCQGKLPGAISLLQEYGLTKTEAGAANFIAQLPEEQFQRVLERPLRPTTVANHLWGKDPVWIAFTRTAMMLRGVLRRHPPCEIQAIARMLGERQEGTLRVVVADLRRMLRQLEGISNDSSRNPNH
ncbi:MAG TPA: hypothetical protein VN750_04755 [Steroidobacteraceae bacterium]|nr:hypothetical protein [Steroidobacteraceae bacterium]